MVCYRAGKACRARTNTQPEPRPGLKSSPSLQRGSIPAFSTRAIGRPVVKVPPRTIGTLLLLFHFDGGWASSNLRPSAGLGLLGGLWKGSRAKWRIWRWGVQKKKKKPKLTRSASRSKCFLWFLHELIFENRGEAQPMFGGCSSEKKANKICPDGQAGRRWVPFLKSSSCSTRVWTHSLPVPGWTASH